MPRLRFGVLLSFLCLVAVMGCQEGRISAPSGVAPTATSGGEQSGPDGNAQPSTPTASPGQAAGQNGSAGILPTPVPTIPAAIPEPAANNKTFPMFSSPPFEGDFPLANFFDHDAPFQWRDTNFYLVTPWGEKTSGVDGHTGYDWLMPIGTPLYAVGEGEITRAGLAEPFHCAPLKRTVDDSLGVIIRHKGPGGRSVFSYYGHMSRVDVKEGDQADSGQMIGLSGNTGCVIERPHLHFAVWVRWGSDPQTYVDPYGWEGEEPDPWLADERGGEESLWLWLPAKAPRLYREVELADWEVIQANAPLLVRYVRWMGWRDDLNPNNEAVRIEINPHADGSRPVSLAGYTLSNGQGQVFTFPKDAAVYPERPVWVYAGPGENADGVFFWGHGGEVWDDVAGCATLSAPDGSPVHELGFVGKGDRAKAPCPTPDMGEVYIR